MAESSNPFEEEDHTDWIDEHQQIQHSETSQVANIVPALYSESIEITWDNIASKLLKDNFILTALELHTELVESGRELPRLRDYFSNPGNFERTKDDIPPPTLPRTASVQTFDSLDFARYSDDGERQVDERVAVLEFELRKAQETIKSLRKTLTKEAENEIVPDRQRKDEVCQEEEGSLRPFEKKAINFLVNEYLMANDYKLTSVTFAEENEDQDFEDWDDVGLNMPKPPSVIQLFRDFGTRIAPLAVKLDCSCQTDEQQDEEHAMLVQELMEKQNHLEKQVMDLEKELTATQLEKEVLSQQVDILKIGGPRSLSTQTPRVAAVKPHRSETSQSSQGTTQQQETSQARREFLPSTQTSFRRDPSPSAQLARDADIAHSAAVSGFELGTAESVVNSESFNVDDMDSLSSTQSTGLQTEQTFGRDAEREADKTSAVEQSYSPPVQSSANAYKSVHGLDAFKGDSHLHSKRHMSAEFHRVLQQTAFHITKDNRIVYQMSQLPKSDGLEMVSLLAQCLPHIVPHILLAKREELIPLILATAMLHPDSKERDRLLNILFNLIKKPDDDQRQVILTGCVVFAEHVGAERLVEELLPQCWEQISHKYVERRLLVAEACGAVASYLPPDMLSSLVLSMLQQMLLDDKDESVREAVVRSLGLLVAFITDADKYSQAFDLLQISLRDPSEKVQNTALQVFLPSFAAWAYELGRLEHQLVHAMLRDLEDLGALAQQRSNNSTTLPLNETRFHLLLNVLQELQPFLYISLLEQCPHSSLDPDEDLTIDLSTQPAVSTPLCDLVVIAGGEDRLKSLVTDFENHIQREWFEPWEQLNWLVNNLIPRLLEVMLQVGVSVPRVVSALCTYIFRLCRIFGKSFTQKKVKLKFQELVDLPEECLDSQVNLGHTAITTSIVPVYTCGVLLAFNTEESRKEANHFLKKVLCTLAYCQTSLDSLRATLLQLRTKAEYHELLLTVLWDGVVHSAAVVRATAASLFELLIKDVSDTLISHRVVPALVTLANDPDMSVRIATIPSLGAIIENISAREVLDRVYMQLQAFFDDHVYRDQHAVHVELIRTLARCGPNAEPRFQVEFIVPRLAAMASANNQMANETKRADIARQLFDAYSAMSCSGFLNDQLIHEALLPGLRCLRHDLAVIAPEHEEVVSSMIRDYENRLEPRADRSGSVTGASGDDVKARMMSRIKDTTFHSNISNIFTRKK